MNRTWTCLPRISLGAEFGSWERVGWAVFQKFAVKWQAACPRRRCNLETEEWLSGLTTFKETGHVSGYTAAKLR